MTRDETIALLAILKAAYPSAYRDVSSRDANAMISLWQDIFADYSGAVVAAAVKAWISTDKKGFVPAPGQIMDKLRLMTTERPMTEAEAWQLVKNACRNGIYNYREEYEKLPPEVQSVLHAPEVLKEYAVMPEDELDTVIASNFQRSYRAVSKHREELRALPQSVKEMLPELAGLTERMAFPE